jgi:hypothetical protein
MHSVMMVHDYSPSTWEAEARGRRSFELKASLGHTVGLRSVYVIKRDRLTCTHTHAHTHTHTPPV